MVEGRHDMPPPKEKKPVYGQYFEDNKPGERRKLNAFEDSEDEVG